MKTVIENYSLILSRFARSGFSPRSIGALTWDVVGALFCAALFGSLALAQDRPALTLNQISDLLKNGVSPARVAQLVEQHGVGFELNELAIRRLRADGADEVVLATVKKMATRYAEEQRRKQLEEANRQKLAKEGKREEATAQRAEEAKRQVRESAKQREEKERVAEVQKRPQAAAQTGAQELASKTEEPKGVIQKPTKSTTATLMSQEDAGRVASLRNVVITEGGEVSGAVVNNSKDTLRDVQLQIVYAWRWKNEHRPGTDDPGTARYYVLSQEIPPNQAVRFNYKPSPPLASRQDGEFDINVKVVGFAQVSQPGR